MVAHWTKSMRPTIIHFPAFDGDMAGRSGCGCRGDSGCGCKGRYFGRRCCGNGIVGAMKSGIVGGEAANAFFIAELELGLEQRDGPIFSWTKAPLFGGGRQQPCLFNHG